MLTKQLYDLKSFLEANYPNTTAAEIVADLSEEVSLPDELTKAELATFFARFPLAERRLEQFVATPPPDNAPDEAVKIYGAAKMALRLLNIPEVNVQADIAAQFIPGLYAAKLLTDTEFEALQQYTRRTTTKGAQSLGYVPTVEQVEAAISLEWPV